MTAPAEIIPVPDDQLLALLEDTRPYLRSQMHTAATAAERATTEKALALVGTAIAAVRARIDPGM